jgi:hypothetical protein
VFTCIYNTAVQANVLINHIGTPKLCDFGLALLTESPATTTLNGDIRGSVRWIAYELVMQAISHDEEAEPTPPTTKSDTWSFASTLLELLTLKVPYHSIRNDIQVLTSIMTNSRLPFHPPSPDSAVPRDPSQRRESPPAQSPPTQSEQSEPNYFAEVYKWPGVWELCKRCWSTNPKQRPTMGTVVHQLGEIKRRGPYEHRDHQMLHSPQTPVVLPGRKHALDPYSEEGHGMHKSPKLDIQELPDSERVGSPLKISIHSKDAAGFRSRSPQTPTMRVGLIHGPEEFVRKPRHPRTSFSTTSGSSSPGAPSSSSSGHSSPRAHPYHTSAFRSNRPGHRRSPSSGSHTPSGGTVSYNTPSSIGPSRAQTIFYDAPQYHSQGLPSGYHSLPSSSRLIVPSDPSFDGSQPVQAYPDHMQYSESHPYHPRYTPSHSASDTPYREASSSGSSTQRPMQRSPLRQPTFPLVEPISHPHPPSSHHMTSQLFPSYPHHPSVSPLTRQTSLASSRTDSLPRSPSPAYPGSEPAVHMVEAEYLGTGYPYNPYPGPQPLTQGSGDITPEQLALLEKQYISFSQGDSPDQSPTRGQATIGKANVNAHSQSMRPEPLHRVSETVQIRTEFLDKYQTLDDLLAHSPSPTESTVDWKDAFPPTRNGDEPRQTQQAPRKEAPAAAVESQFAAYRNLGRGNSPVGSPISFPTSRNHSGSLRPQYASEWTESPGMRGRSIEPEGTPSLRPGLTLLTPLPTTSELFDEEAVVIEEDEDEDGATEPPDSYMSKMSHDFDEETDVDPDEHDSDLWNSVIPFGVDDLDSEDRFSHASSLENGEALFGGRIEDQYWRHEEHLNGAEHGPYTYSRESTPTPRQQHVALPPTPKGLGIKISAA